MFVVIAESKVTAGQVIYLIKAKRKRWRVVGRVGNPGPQEFATVERAQAEIRRATQDLTCEVITKETFCKLWVNRRTKQELVTADSHLARILDIKLGSDAEHWPVETDDDIHFDDGASDGGYTELKV